MCTRGNPCPPGNCSSAATRTDYPSAAWTDHPGTYQYSAMPPYRKSGPLLALPGLALSTPKSTPSCCFTGPPCPRQSQPLVGASPDHPDYVPRRSLLLASASPALYYVPERKTRPLTTSWTTASTSRGCLHVVDPRNPTTS